jgi:uncharacterized repeat protein (TIGR01451 family)
MKENIGNRNRGIRAALFLAAGLLVTLLALVATPVLFAQDDGEPDADPEVFITTSREDLEDLPLEVRRRLEQENGLSSANDFEIGESTKTVNRQNVLAGEELTYTVVARNTGDADTQPLSIVDALPEGLTYVGHDVAMDNSLPDPNDPGGEKNNVVTWNGVIGPGGSVELTILATVAKAAKAGTEITNTAVITAGEKTAEPGVKITVVDKRSEPTMLLPVITYGEVPLTPDISDIQSTRPNSQNTWTVSWTSPGGFNFELQESMSPGFENAAPIAVGAEAAMTFTHDPSPFNVYYYRARSVSGGVTGNWSQIVKVVGGYYDDFSNDPGPTAHVGDAGRWQIRRTSYIDEVNSWYETTSDYSALILEVSDRWDLGLVSPLMEAPTIPYAIELKVKSVEPGWQKGLGLVFEGDKVGDKCPPDGTLDGWYKHNECFNEFYEFMLVEGADKKNLQVQRIHEVCWQCSPGGIPVHRKVAKNWYIEKISGVSWDDYNIMRVEVRADRIDFWAGESGSNLKHQLSIDENYYPDNTYFGVISTTQEYSNSVGRYRYFSVLPLDS